MSKTSPLVSYHLFSKDRNANNCIKDLSLVVKFLQLGRVPNCKNCLRKFDFGLIFLEPHVDLAEVGHELWACHELTEPWTGEGGAVGFQNF